MMDCVNLCDFIVVCLLMLCDWLVLFLLVVGVGGVDEVLDLYYGSDEDF